MEVYLDHGATTYVDPRVKAAMEPFFAEHYGNPGSFNQMGFQAKQAVDSSRECCARILNAQPHEIVFTGSGTESINLALKGVAFAKKSGHIVTSQVEHPAVLETCRALEKQGFDVTYVSVDKQGRVDPARVEAAIRPDTFLISIIYANNEIGTINPIAEIGTIARKHNVLFHTDACQAVLLELDVEKLNVDLLTLNASKVYAPKGVGLLYVRQGVKLEPVLHGGGQEHGLRSGTENVPGIVGFAAGLEIARAEREQEAARLTQLRDKLTQGILSLPKTQLNGHPTERLSNNVNVSFEGIEAESLLLHLNDHKIYASAGSACTSRKLEPSHVLRAIKLGERQAHSSIRFSLGKKTTAEQIEYVLEVLPKVMKTFQLAEQKL